MLTIIYITSRREPMIDWFFESLHEQCAGDYFGLAVVLIDFFAESRGGDFLKSARCPVIHRSPKPTVWQGPHRLTQRDYWAKCNSANTGLALCDDGWVSLMDDLSVLGPCWLDKVRRATLRPMTCTLGAFKKVKDLKVVDGRIESFTPFPPGVDSRWEHGRDDGHVAASGSWMYGHVTAPLEAFLAVNGYPELLCDSLSFEDVITGIAIERAGYRFVYDRNIMVYESEEHHHHEGRSGIRFDKGITPKDKSHAVLDRVQAGDFSLWNNYNLRALRQKVRGGEPFPIPTEPTTDFYDGQPLGEL